MLLIDAGNSRIKSGIAADGSITTLTTIETASATPPADWMALARPAAALVSNVAGQAIATKISEWVDVAWSLETRFVTVRHQAAGVRTNYDDPTMLGVDRWLAALAAYRIANGAVAVVDAGTATTLDVVSADGTHLGGSISPGVSLMVDSLTRNTADLKLDAVRSGDKLATNTTAAISTGCIDALAGGIEKSARKITTLLGDEPQWIITGGEARRVMEVCELAFRHVPELVLQGLLLCAEDQP